MKLSKLRFLVVGVVMALFVGGCFSISQYHLGYHHEGDGKLSYSVVSEESVVGLEQFEQQCIKGFVTKRLETLRPVFAPKLNEAISEQQLLGLNNRLKELYDLNGDYERLQVVEERHMLDEAADKDAFEYYDLVNANYLLRGNIFNAVVQLYMTKIDGTLRLAGFEIMDYGKNPKGTNDVIMYIFPESTDKAKLKGRYRY